MVEQSAVSKSVTDVVGAVSRFTAGFRPVPNWLWIFASAIFLIVASAWYFLRIYPAVLMRDSLAVAEGQILRMHPYNHALIDYQFEANGATYRGTFSDGILFRTARVGEKIPVYFNSNNPRSNALQPPDDFIQTGRFEVCFAALMITALFSYLALCLCHNKFEESANHWNEAWR